MKLINLVLLIIILVFGPLKSEDKNELLKTKILKNIRCLICQGQSVYDSQSDFSISMKLVVEKKLDEGFNEKEIYTFLKNQYGSWIIYDPEFSKNTLILWLLPILLFCIGGAIIMYKIILKKNEHNK